MRHISFFPTTTAATVCVERSHEKIKGLETRLVTFPDPPRTVRVVIVALLPAASVQYSLNEAQQLHLAHFFQLHIGTVRQGVNNNHIKACHAVFVSTMNVS